MLRMKLKQLLMVELNICRWKWFSLDKCQLLCNKVLWINHIIKRILIIVICNNLCNKVLWVNLISKWINNITIIWIWGNNKITCKTLWWVVTCNRTWCKWWRHHKLKRLMSGIIREITEEEKDDEKICILLYFYEYFI